MNLPYRFPADLLALARAQHDTYTALAHAPAGASTASLRRRLVLLDLHLASHPYWASPAHWRTGTAELRRTVRTRP
ncbi:hypothetical protein [Streptomyces sp. NPDC058401]|uniref:hypothetical protein n=1 Tax=Streptomyces sp. NPDC058401 TaxID=3346480 RepID=UPI00365E5868